MMQERHQMQIPQVDVLKCRYLGKPIIILSADNERPAIEMGTKGIVTSVTNDGRLIAQCQEGRQAVIHAGEDVFALDISMLSQED